MLLRLIAEVEHSGRTVPCRSGDAELFFAELPADVERAKALCVECPVRVACLTGALERAEPWGVWGGELFEAGRVVPRKRPRGRPRKTDLEREAALAVATAERVAAALDHADVA